MPVPGFLSDRYSHLRLVHETSKTEIWRAEDRNRRDVAIKVADAYSGGAVDEVIAELRDANLLPEALEEGEVGNGRRYIVSPWYSFGDLGTWRKSEPREVTADKALLREFVRQMIDALHIIHQGQVPTGAIVFGRLRPGNILVDRQPSQTAFRLTGLGNVQSVAESAGATAMNCYAPEMISGAPLPASDYWALGSVLFEWLTGRKPLAGFSEEAIRRAVGGDWRPTVEDAAIDEWRALLFGLLDRNVITRWGFQEVTRWLNRDEEIIARGLARGDERYAESPFSISGVPVRAAVALARTLHRSWAVNELMGEQLPQWLELKLHRGDLAAYLRNIQQQARNDAASPTAPDLALLEFCHTIVSGLPAVWRGIPISETAIDAQAAIALVSGPELVAPLASQGTSAEEGAPDGAVQWLSTLLEGGVFEFHDQRGNQAVAELGQRLRRAIACYRELWQRLISGSPPAVAEMMRPPEDLGLPMVVRAILSKDTRDSLARHQALFDASPLGLFEDPVLRIVHAHCDHPEIKQLVLHQCRPIAPEADSPMVVDQSYLRDPPVWDEWRQRLIEAFQLASIEDPAAEPEPIHYHGLAPVETHSMDVKKVHILGGRPEEREASEQFARRWSSPQHWSYRWALRTPGIAVFGVFGWALGVGVALTSLIAALAKRQRIPGAIFDLLFQPWLEAWRYVSAYLQAAKTPPIELSLRVLPLKIQGLPGNSTAGYLALIEWRTAEPGYRIRLHIDHPGDGPDRAHLMTKPLQPKGRYLLPLFQSSRIWATLYPVRLRPPPGFLDPTDPLAELHERTFGNLAWIVERIAPTYTPPLFVWFERSIPAIVRPLKLSRASIEPFRRAIPIQRPTAIASPERFVSMREHLRMPDLGPFKLPSGFWRARLSRPSSPVQEARPRTPIQPKATPTATTGMGPDTVPISPRDRR